jgi:hypothetical protein
MRRRLTALPTSVLLAGALLAPSLLGACSHLNPFGDSDRRGYTAPRRMGSGDCSAQLINLSGRPLEVYFFFGIQNPPRITAAWPRLGVLEPLSSSVLYGDCDDRRMRIRAFATGPTDPQNEYAYTTRELALVKGRKEIIRLRLAR